MAIGEIGFDNQTISEEKEYFRLQIELAKKLSIPIIVHTPHKEKLKDLTEAWISEEHNVNPNMVVNDHNTEETVDYVRGLTGFLDGFTIYPRNKNG